MNFWSKTGRCSKSVTNHRYYIKICILPHGSVDCEICKPGNGDCSLLVVLIAQAMVLILKSALLMLVPVLAHRSSLLSVNLAIDFLLLITVICTVHGLVETSQLPLFSLWNRFTGRMDCL